MIEIQGKYGSARVFADALEPTAAEQLRTLCDQRFVEGCRLRIMPDVHAGAGCVIGFTADLDELVHFETVHNYIDLESNIVRKGAVSARAGERLLIPINMRDGSLICVGKGNPDWNESAPHGAGRLFSRTEARERFTAQEFRDAMTGVYTTSAGEKTLDECPMAYKSMDAIVSQIGPTAEIERIIRPEYNFKAEE